MKVDTKDRLILLLEDIEVKKSMTIIMAWRESNISILIGADSHRVNSLDFESVYMKLHRIKDAPIAWGCAGNGELIEKFDKWLEGQLWPPNNWYSFEDKVRKKLADINNKQRKYTERSGAKWNDDYGISCLLVGQFNDELHMITYEDTGITEDYIYEGYGALGSGKRVSTVVYRTIEKIGKLDENKFRILLETTIERSKGCKKPMVIWRVKEEDIEIIHNGVEEYLKNKDKRF